MDGNCTNSEESKGKVKAKCIFEEGKGSEAKDSEKESIVENLSSNAEANIPNQDQAFPDPDGDHVVDPAGVNDQSPRRVTEKENQGSPVAFPDLGGDHVAEPSPVNVPSLPRVAKEEDQGSPVALPDPGGDHVAEPEAVNVRGPVKIEQEEENPARVAFPEPGDDHVAEVVAVNIPPPPRVGQEEDAQERRAYSCRHCDLLFPSAQALGGHQNGHKNVRDCAKRQKGNEDMPLSYSSLGNTQSNYGDYPNSAIGYPQVPLYNGNMFFYPRIPLGNPFSRPVVPNIQNPRSNTEFTAGQSGQTSGMFNSTQLPVYGRPGMVYPYSWNYGNSNSLETVGGRQGGMLEGFRAPTINSISIGSAYNSMGTVGGSGSGSTSVGILRPYENSRIFAGGFDAAGTIASTSRNIFELSVGGRSYNETQDMFRGHDGSDGTIDLLSRVGMGSGKDAETDTDGGSKETES